MKRNSEYKNQGYEALEGNWLKAAAITLLYSIILQVPSYPRNIFEDELWSSSFSIIIILLLPLLYGFTVMFLDLLREKQLKFETLFDGFKEYGRILGTMFLVEIYTLLWTLLLIIPGIIKSYSYSQTSYIMRDNPELSYNAAIEESMRIMSGKKMKLFLFDLSFIGWFILSLFTLGIGLLFLTPYFKASRAAFYEDLKSEDNSAKEVIID